MKLLQVLITLSVFAVVLMSIPSKMKCLPKQVCKPLNMYVDVTTNPVLLKRLVQHKVLLKQCAGSCFFGKKCLPVKTRNITVSVMSINKLCEEFHVQEHTKCKCGCETKCNKNQRQNARTCECMCKKRNKECPEGVNWNPNTCRCDCSKTECSTGSKWNITECRCVTS